MPETPSNTPVLELRVALTTRAYDRLVQFYQDALGVEPADFFQNDGGRGLLLYLGRASLEIFDEAQAAAVDQIETGGRTSGPVRFALQVPDLAAAVERLLAHGAVMVHPPVTTPWGDQNARFQDPDGMQITLFQAADSSAAR